MLRTTATPWTIVAACCLIAGLAALGVWQARDRRGLAQQTSRLTNELATERSTTIAMRAHLLTLEGKPEAGALLALEHMITLAPSARSVEASLYAALQATRARTVLAGHTASVRSAVFSDDGEKILTASQDTTARLWETRTGRVLTTLSGHTAPLRDAAFCGQGTRIVTTPEATSETEDGIRLWDAATGALLATVAGHETQCSPSGRWVAVLGKDVTLLDAATGATAATYAYTANTFAFSPSDQFVTVLAKPATLQILDLATRKLSGEISLESGEFQSAAFSANGRHLLTTDVSGGTQLWEIATGQRVHAFAGEHAETSLLTDDGRYLVSGEGQLLRIWDLQNGTQVQTFAKSEITSEGWTSLQANSGKLLALPMVFGISVVGTPLVVSLPEQRAIPLKGHEGSVHSARLSPDARRAVTASEDGSARVWDTESGQMLFALNGHGAALTHARFSPDGRTILTASDDGTARLWSAASRADDRLLHLDQAPEAIAISRDGQRTALAFADGRVQMLDAIAMTPLRTVATACAQGHNFSPDLRWVLCRGPDAPETQIWDLTTSRRTGALPVTATTVWRPLAPIVATPAAGGGIDLHDVARGQVRHLLEKQRVNAIVFDAEGRGIAAITREAIILADLESGKAIRTLALTDDSFLLHAYSASKNLVVGLAGETALATVIIDAKTGQKIRTIDPEGQKLGSHAMLGADAVAFLGGAERLLVSESETTFRIFDVATGVEVAALRPLTANAQRSAWSLAPGTGHLVSVWQGHDHARRPVLRTARIFLTAAAVVEGAKRDIPACLTLNERRALDLAPTPPDYCITGAGLETEPDSSRWQPKWPYRSAAWRGWLAAKRQGRPLPLPHAD